ncbi:unnamed protein product, partial [Oikopleura dioica]
MAETKALGKLLTDHAKQAKHEIETRAAKIQIPEYQYEHAKQTSSTEIEQLKIEIEDLTIEKKNNEEITKELITTLAKFREKQAILKNLNDKPVETWSAEESSLYDDTVPSELKKKIQDIESEILAKYTAKGTITKLINERENKIVALETTDKEHSRVTSDIDPTTGEKRFWRTQLGTNLLPQPDGESLENMGREFRTFLCTTATQRTFLRDDLMKLLSRYTKSMGPTLSAEKQVIDKIKDDLIRNPDLPRKEALVSCQAIMTPQMRHDFERTLTINMSNPHYKKQILAPADGSMDNKGRNNDIARGGAKKHKYDSNGHNYQPAKRTRSDYPHENHYSESREKR